MNKRITLKSARVNLGLTQVEMAKKLGISPTTYCKYERNPETVTFRTAREIAQLLDMDVKDIIFCE